MAKGRIATVILHGMTGYGASKAEAKKDAEAKIRRVLDGTYTPKMLRFDGGHIGLVYRDIYSWKYNILAPDCRERLGCICSGYEAPDAAERALRIHVAQNLIGTAPDNGLSALENTEDRKSHLRYIAWQEGYAALKAKGFSDEECHKMASDSAA